MGSVSHTLTLKRGHILRHGPSKGAQGREAALIDVAQDLLLRALSDAGVLELVTFKGGTALRKVLAGASGRFSTDLDFSVANMETNPQQVLELILEAIDGLSAGPFRYGIQERRGRAHITYANDLGFETGELSSKLDVGPPPWLPTTQQAWVPLPIHNEYGGPLPLLPVVRIEENIAEKIARLNRRTFARDMYDLIWLAQKPRLDLDQALIRRLAVLKCWVDKNGLASEHHSWNQIGDARELDVERWLRPRTEQSFDDEQIGLLTTPTPHLADLAADLIAHYSWLRNLDETETILSAGKATDRNSALSQLKALEGSRLEHVW